MIRFRERNLKVVGAITIVVVVALIAGALEFAKLPLVNSAKTSQAYFASAGGLEVGDVVTVHGVKVGHISHMALDGDRVRVSMLISPGIHLGATSTAAAKVLSPIGTEYVELSPSGPGDGHAIPTSRTTIPYTLVADLAGLGQEIQQYNIPKLQAALRTGGESLSATQSSDVDSAFDGLARLSQVLGDDQGALSAIVQQGSALTGVLSSRSAQLVDLFGQSNLVLEVLTQRRQAITELLTATTALSRQISGILTSERLPLGGLLKNLQTVSAALAQDSDDIGSALPLLAAFSRYSANSSGSGPFVDASAPALLVPDNILKACSAKGTYPSANPQVGCRP